jgi:glycosyltransferase involved in cell wall biosynthesis
MQVTVSCPTKFHAFYLAEQLYKHSSLKYLYTSYFGRWGSKQNDRGIHIPRSHVRTNLATTVLYYGYNPGTHLFRSRIYGNWVADQLGDEDLVVTWGLSALPIIERAHQLGMKVVVERGSSHAAYQRDILLEEYEKWGAPTDALRRSFSPERMEQELLEYKMADSISIPSSFVERTFLENGITKDKLIKVPYGVDLREFRQMPKQDDVFRVVFAGSMELQKGVHYLLQAFSELKLPDAELWLVGGAMPDIEPFFKRYAGAFHHFGHQPQAKLHEYYSQCSVFAICSIQEGLALVQPQAMACGLPLLCTLNSGGEDLIENGKEGFVLPIREVEALKEKILFLYEHQEICYEMGQAAKRKVRQGLTWDDYGNKMLDAYHTISGNGCD